ncbi:flagellar hook-length control protein FliK [Achromobacter sp. GG226]|nr:flagellar hook-length control protein FliK [Verticiella sp. GG226]
MPAAPAGAGLLEPGVGAPLHSPQWAPALGRQMVLLGSAEGGTIRHAELRLDPPDLGPLRVSLNLSGDQATAVFVSPHPAVRAAVEAALPQLQQALAEAGIQLGNTSVGDQGSWQEARESSQGQGRGRDGEGDDAGQTVAGTEPTITRAAPRGLIDTFA